RADRVEKLITGHPKLVAWMALALLEVTSPNPTPLQAILSERSAQLPLGSVLPVFWGSGCGGFVEVKPGDDTSYQNRPMPACGMPSLSSTGGRFLRFVGEK
ncbi:MAG: hypothetical protein KDB53_13890, partial [Planctomycetes bacterium]|nr:hypothetical protein [Planctomycetota bacterium]